MEAFQAFDDGNKGFLTKDDLRQFLKTYNENMTEDEINLMFDEADYDKDGKITFKDFVLMMMS